MWRGRREGSQGELQGSDIRNSVTVTAARLDKHGRREGQALEERHFPQWPYGQIVMYLKLCLHRNFQSSRIHISRDC